jgi:hypothetical protein
MKKIYMQEDIHVAKVAKRLTDLEAAGWKFVCFIGAQWQDGDHDYVWALFEGQA